MCIHYYPAHTTCKHWQRAGGVRLPETIKQCPTAAWGNRTPPCGAECPDADRRQPGEDWSWEPIFRDGVPEFCAGCSGPTTRTSSEALVPVFLLLSNLRDAVLVHDWRVRHQRVLDARADVPRMEDEAAAVVRTYEALTWKGPLNPAEGYLRTAHADFKHKWDRELARRERDAAARRAEQSWDAVMAAINPRMNNEIEGAIETPMPGLPPWGSHSPRFPTSLAYHAYYGTGGPGASSSGFQAHAPGHRGS